MTWTGSKSFNVVSSRRMRINRNNRNARTKEVCRELMLTTMPTKNGSQHAKSIKFFPCMTQRAICSKGWYTRRSSTALILNTCATASASGATPANRGDTVQHESSFNAYSAVKM